jgi:hypothetical protein
MPNKFREQQGSQAVDPFNRAVPGFSLTQEPGRWPWEKPPKFVQPADAVDSIIDNLEDPQTREEVAGLMLAGVSVEELVSIFSVHGMAKGAFNPDVAEIIKGPIAMYLLGMADEYQIPVKVFGNDEAYRKKNRGMSDTSLLQIMRQRNPEVYETVTSMVPSDVEQALQRERSVAQESFLREDEPEMEEEAMDRMMQEPFIEREEIEDEDYEEDMD